MIEVERCFFSPLHMILSCHTALINQAVDLEIKLQISNMSLRSLSQTTTASL